MDKRGQIYLLIALVMSVVIFGLVTVTNQANQESMNSDFEKLSQNYASESAKLVNSMMAVDPSTIGDDFKKFSFLFTSYSKTQSPDFGLIYAFQYGGKLYLGNYLKSDIEIDCDTCPDVGYPRPVPGCYGEIPASVGFDGLSVKVQGVYTSIIEQCSMEEGAFKGGKVPASLYVKIEDVPYTFTLKKDQPQIIMVSWESKGNQRKVFTEGELVEGNTLP